MNIFIGKQVSGYSTTQVLPGTFNFSLAFGRCQQTATQDAAPIATFSVHGISGVITDIEKVAALKAAYEATEYADIKALLHRYVLESYSNDLEAFERLMQERYSDGIEEGHRQKRKQFRDFIDAF